MTLLLELVAGVIALIVLALLSLLVAFLGAISAIMDGILSLSPLP